MLPPAGLGGANHLFLELKEMEMNWSRWFRCESSFGLLLVPSQPGVFALAEEVEQPTPGGRRTLAVFEVAETEDLALALSRMFAAGSPWRQKLNEGHCYARYAVAPSVADRRVATAALKRWLESQREVASQIGVPATVAERAVDRVAQEYAKAFSAIA